MGELLDSVFSNSVNLGTGLIAFIGGNENESRDVYRRRSRIVCVLFNFCYAVYYECRVNLSRILSR